MIVKQTGDVVVLGLAKLPTFISLISLNIGFTNLLPIPFIDCGQVILATIEAVRRKVSVPRLLYV
jgi:membrane-associated protease RseP (regulator of RpoE activity)